MKKILIVLAFLGVFTLWSPRIAADNDNCTTVILVCGDGTQHYVVCCDGEDVKAWAFLLCGVILTD